MLCVMGSAMHPVVDMHGIRCLIVLELDVCTPLYPAYTLELSGAEEARLSCTYRRKEDSAWQQHSDDLGQARCARTQYLTPGVTSDPGSA